MPAGAPHGPPPGPHGGAVGGSGKLYQLGPWTPGMKRTGATSALSSGTGYDELLERIMRFGLAYEAAWRQT